MMFTASRITVLLILVCTATAQQTSFQWEDYLPSGTDASEDYFQWVKDSGIELKGVKIERCRSHGPCIMATQDLKPGDEIIRVPLSAVITDTLVHNSEPVKVFKKIADGNKEVRDSFGNQPIYTTIWFMFSRNDASDTLKSYIASLPKTFVGAGTWTEKQMSDFETIAGLSLRAEQQKVKANFDVLKANVFDRRKDVFDEELATYENFVWSLRAVASRNFGGREAGGNVEKHSAWMIPVVDLANCWTDGHTYVFKEYDDAIALKVSSHIPEGDQVYFHYALKGSEYYLNNYGFAPENNPHESITFDWSLPNVLYTGASAFLEQYWREHPRTYSEYTDDGQEVMYFKSVFYKHSVDADTFQALRVIAMLDTQSGKLKDIVETDYKQLYESNFYTAEIDLAAARMMALVIRQLTNMQDSMYADDRKLNELREVLKDGFPNFMKLQLLSAYENRVAVIERNRNFYAICENYNECESRLYEGFEDVMTKQRTSSESGTEPKKIAQPKLEL
eukprot:GFYU01017778.1.p1 GENE.GFYU01017778.1~~GFYU01017778.1.p1  ORF type:complete len:506 (+),score=106.70 GFYU01017778.1:148-1665(+)